MKICQRRRGNTRRDKPKIVLICTYFNWIDDYYDDDERWSRKYADSPINIKWTIFKSNLFYWKSRKPSKKIMWLTHTLFNSYIVYNDILNIVLILRFKINTFILYKDKIKKKINVVLSFKY